MTKASRNSAFDIPILMYHDVQLGDAPPNRSYTLSLQAFEKQLDLLSHSRCVIGFETLFDIIEGRKLHTGREVIITFDDGYQSFRTLALPALAARRLIATVFVVASQIGGYNKWDMDTGQSRDKRALMDEQALKEVIEAGIEIGVHGWAHRDLKVCSAAELSDEIVKSKEYLEDLFGIDVKTFAYPYGGYSRDHFEPLQSAGYRGAVSIFSDEQFVTSNPYAMRRVYVHPKDNKLRFRLKLSRAYLRYKAFRGIPREPSGALEP